MRLFINDAFVLRDKKTLPFYQLLAQRINSYMEAEDNVNASDLTKRPNKTTKDPTELLKMVHSLQNDLQSRDSTAPEMLVTLESIGRQYAKEVQAKKYLQPKISSVFKQNNYQNSTNNNQNTRVD